jgi:hypothetical protein
MAVGTYVSHCYVLAATSPAQHVHAHGGHAHHGSGAATSGLAFFCGLPFVLACVGALTLFVCIRIAQEAKGRPDAAIAAWPFGLLAPAGFLLHHMLASTAAGTLGAGFLVEPAFLLSLLLQVPFGFVTYLVAKALLTVATRIGRALAARPVRTSRAPARIRTALLPARPRLALLASAAAPRAPPLPA